MNKKIQDIAQRIHGMRDILDISTKEMSELLEITEEEYMSYEKGEKDFTFSFLHTVSRRFNIDLTDLLTGRSPKLAEYAIVRKGEGLPIDRREGFEYESLAFRFKGRIAEPFVVKAKYEKKAPEEQIVMNTHDGQEFNYVLKGALKIKIEKHETILNEGDCVYYNAKLPHGMIAFEDDCEFMAIIVNDNDRRTSKDA